MAAYMAQQLPGPEPIVVPRATQQPMPWEDPVPQPAAAPVAAAAQQPMPWEDAVGPAPKPQPSEFGRLLNIAGESSGAKFFEGILGGGAQALMGRIAGTPDTNAEERFVSALKSGLFMLRDEPMRLRDELVKADQALRNDDLIGGARHLSFAVPFLGAAGSRMQEYLDKGDYAGALAHAGGVLGGALIASPESQGAIASGAGAVGGAIGETAATAGTAASGAFTGLREAVPTAFKSALEKAPYAAAGGIPAMVTVAKGAFLKELGQGLFQGARGALKARAAAAADALAREQAARNVPVPEPPFQPAGLLGPGPIITPQTDTTFVGSRPLSDVAPGMAEELARQEATRAAGAPSEPIPAQPAAAPEPALTLDALSQSLAGKSFAKLNEGQKAQVQSVYDRIQNPLPVSQPTPADLATETPPGRAVSLEYNAPAAPSIPEPPAPAAPPPAPAPFDFAAAPRAAKVNKLAQTMRDHGLTANDASIMDPSDWRMLARKAGINEPSGVTIADVIKRMRDLEEPPPAAGAPAPGPGSPGEPPPAPAGAAAAVPEHVQSMLDTIPNVKYSLAKTFGPVEWETLEDLAGIGKTSDATRQAVLDRIQQRELPASVAKMTPEEARAALEASRKGKK